MSLEALKQDVEQRQFCRFYFLYGSEPYLKQFYLRQLIAAALPDNTDLDLHRFEGQKTDPETFSEALWQYPAGENQVLLVQDLPLSSPLAAFLAGDDCEIPENTLVVVYDQYRHSITLGQSNFGICGNVVVFFITVVTALLDTAVPGDSHLFQRSQNIGGKRGCFIGCPAVDPGFCTVALSFITVERDQIAGIRLCRRFASLRQIEKAVIITRHHNTDLSF